MITYPSVPARHPDEAPLDCLASILGEGQNSVFYQELVKTQKVLSATASNPTAELAGQFFITITPFPGTSLADTKKLIDDAVKTFEKRGVTDEDIARFTGPQEASLIYGLATVSGKVNQLANFQTMTGNPNQIGNELKRYVAVTKADVWRVYHQYVKGKPAVILSVATKAQPDDVVAPANYTVSRASYVAPDYGYAGLKYAKPTDTFDRSKTPASATNPVLKLPPLWRENLAGGVKAIGIDDRELPVIQLAFSMPGGHLVQNDDRSKAGLARLFAQMMNEDTQDRSVEDLQQELRKLGSSVNVTSDLDGIGFLVQTLKKNLDRTLALLEERMLRPKFTEAAFARIKRQALEGFKTRKSRPAVVADEVFAKINQGADSILGISQMGTEETVQKIELADVQDYYQRFMTSRGGRLVVVGDTSGKDIVKRLGFLAKLPDRAIKLPAVPPAPKVDKTRIYLVDVPRAAQTEFRVGYATGLKWDATGEFYRAGLMNFPFGGDFNSRINLDLREDKGWTYGARSGFMGNKYTGVFSFSSGIRGDATDAALVEVMGEEEKYANSGVTVAELNFMKSAIAQREARAYESPTQKISFIEQILEYNLPANFVDVQNKILSGITKNEIDQLAARWMRTGATNILLVGDKAKILPGLQKMSYEIVELDVDGNRINRAYGKN